MKLTLLLVAIGLTSISAIAQTTFPKGPSFSIGLQGSNNVSGPNFGVSGSVSVLWPVAKTAGSIPNNWVASLKLSQLKGTSGKLFSAFDGGKSGNLSIASVLVGYRLSLSGPSDHFKPFQRTGGWYIEGLTGVSFAGTENVHPTLGANLGYYITRHFDLNVSGQWLQDYGKDIWILGLGGTFTLK